MSDWFSAFSEDGEDKQDSNNDNSISLIFNVSFQDTLDALEKAKPPLQAAIREFLSKYEGAEFYSKLISEKGPYGEYGVSECGFDLYQADSRVKEVEQDLKKALSPEFSENERTLLESEIQVAKINIEGIGYEIERLNVEIDYIRRFGKGNNEQKNEKIEKKSATIKKKQETISKKNARIEELKAKLVRGPERNVLKEEKLKERYKKAVSKRDALIETIKRTNYMTTY